VRRVASAQRPVEPPQDRAGRLHRHVLRRGRRHPDQPALPGEQPARPAVARVDAEPRRIHGGEPAAQRHAEARVEEPEGQPVAARQRPPRVAPAPGPERLEQQTEVHRPVPDVRQVHGDGRGAAAASAGRPAQVRGGRGVPQAVRRPGQDLAAPHQGGPPLELGGGEVDAMPEQALERDLDAVSLHHPAQVAELAAGTPEEGQVGARRVAVDPPAGHLEEVVRATPAAAGERLAGLRRRDGVAQEPRQVAGEAAGEAQLLGERHGGLTVGEPPGPVNAPKGGRPAPGRRARPDGLSGAAGAGGRARPPGRTR
jgi:hypothetical protein